MEEDDLPAPFVGRALIDAGAGCTCVDPSVTAALDLEPRGREDMVTPSTGTGHYTTTQYDLSLIIPPEPDPKGSRRDAPLVLDALPVIHAELLTRQGIHALIGRDVLSRCILNYNGAVGYFSLEW